MGVLIPTWQILIWRIRQVIDDKHLAQRIEKWHSVNFFQISWAQPILAWSFSYITRYGEWYEQPSYELSQKFAHLPNFPIR